MARMAGLAQPVRRVRLARQARRALTGAARSRPALRITPTTLSPTTVRRTSPTTPTTARRLLTLTPVNGEFSPQRVRPARQVRLETLEWQARRERPEQRVQRARLV